MKNKRLKKDEAVLVVIDFQERLLPAMCDHEELEATAAKLIKGVGVFGLPIIVTQQYTKGLGETTEPIRAALGPFKHVEKTSFSAMLEPDFIKALGDTGRKSIILCGIESHICVQQTALDLMDEGWDVFVAVDCIASRKEADDICAQKRIGRAGAVLMSYEAILYEMLGNARTDGFREISAIVK